MDEGHKYCRQCKREWNPMLHDSDTECPHCGHQMTFLEAIETQFFGKLGFKVGGLIIALVIFILFCMAK